MDFRHLRTFRLVAQTLNFTKAAHILNYAQSNVTAHIKALENELDAQLFERLGKQITLTPAGEQLLCYAERILKLADEAKDLIQSQDEPSGALTIGGIDSLCTYRLPRLLNEFRARYPSVRLILQPSFTSNDLLQSVHDGALDVAFLLDDPVKGESLIANTLETEELVIVAHPGHPLTELDQVTPCDISKEEVVLMEAGCSWRKAFERALAAEDAHVLSSVQFGSAESLKQCVLVGMGITVLPRFAVTAELADGRLKSLPWSGPPLQLCTQVVHHKDKWVTAALHAFLKMTEEWLGSESGFAVNTNSSTP